MVDFNFAPAEPGGEIVFGACRPCHERLAPETTVDDWIAFMDRQGIERVCCLLDDHHLSAYPSPLLESYESAFETANVLHAPVEDFNAVDATTLHDSILPFLRAAEADEAPVVLHCSAGIGRTGHVLALWLVLDRGYGLDEAIEIQRRSGREPLEGASRAELEELISSSETIDE